jgi:hypothetical protein
MFADSKELDLLTEACRSLPEGEDYRCDDYVKNILLTVLEFASNTASVNRAIGHFRRTHGGQITSHEAINTLVHPFADDRDGNTALAVALWDYKLWSRAELLRRFLEYLDSAGVYDQDTLAKWATETCYSSIAGRIRTPRHTIGPEIFHWLQIRVGVPTVKADVHIVRFVSSAIGRNLSSSEAFCAVHTVASRLGRNPSLLDAAIWRHQKAVPLTRKKRRSHSSTQRHEGPNLGTP